MMTVLLVIHIIITLALVGMVLIQRSEGGGLGMGGGGGGGGFMTTRGTANAMTRMTMYLAVGFFLTSISLGILAGAERTISVDSVVDPDALIPQSEETVPAAPQQDDDLPAVPTQD